MLLYKNDFFKTNLVLIYMHFYLFVDSGFDILTVFILYCHSNKAMLEKL